MPHDEFETVFHGPRLVPRCMRIDWAFLKAVRDSLIDDCSTANYVWYQALALHLAVHVDVNIKHLAWDCKMPQAPRRPSARTLSRYQ